MTVCVKTAHHSIQALKGKDRARKNRLGRNQEHIVQDAHGDAGLYCSSPFRRVAQMSRKIVRLLYIHYPKLYFGSTIDGMPLQQLPAIVMSKR